MVNEVEKSQVKEAAVWGIGPTFSYFQPSKHVTVFSNEELVDNRQLFTEAFSSFLVFQKQIEDVENDSQRQEVISSFSRMYLALIKAQIDQLTKIEEQPKLQNFGCPDGKTMKEYENQIGYWKRIFSIWHLSEIFLTSSATYVSNAFLNWIKRNIRDPRNYYNENTIWNLLYHYLLRGEITKAVEVFRNISSSGEFDEKLALDIEAIISTVPRLGHSVSTFDRLRLQWHEECVQLSKDPNIENNPNYKDLFGILLGKRELFTSRCKNLHWMELIGAEILYNQPKIINSEVHNILNHITIPQNESIFGSIINRDAISVLNSFKNEGEMKNSWVLCHMTDLFYHANILEMDDEEKETLREYTIIEYAVVLLRDNRFWQLAFSYLPFCDKRGKTVLAHFIERVPLDNDRKVFKLLNLCKLHELPEQEKAICHSMAMKCLQENRYGSCMEWLNRINDEKRIRQVANKMIAQAIEIHDIKHILESLGSDFVFSESFQFLVDFQTLLESFQEHDYSTTKECVLRILQSKRSPTILRLSLVAEFLPKLLDEQNEGILFNSEEIYEVMNLIEEVYLYYEIHPEELPTKYRSNMDTIQKSRYQLVQNLYQVFVEQDFIV